MIDRILRLFARTACRSPWTVVATGAIIAVAATIYASLELRLNADTDDLIASGKEYKRIYDAFLEEFGDLEYIYAVVERGENRDRAEAAVDFLASRLKLIDELPGIHVAIDPEEQLRLATRSMSEDELREFVLTADALPALARGDPGRTLYEASARLNELITRGLQMSEAQREAAGAAAVLLLSAWAAATPETPLAGPGAEAARNDMAMLLRVGLDREYLRSASGELYFVTILPVKDYGTLAVIEEPLRRIRWEIDAARAAFPDVRIGLTGKPVLQADELTTSDRDMRRASILAVSLIALLFMAVLGGVWHPALAVLALLMGIAWAFGMTTLVIGELNLLSIIFTLVLVGVGIDFGVHLTTRYREERRHAPVEVAIDTAVRTAGHGNVTGALTSSIAFYMALFTEFKGLRDLGFIAGTGLLLCLLSMTLVLPSLIVLQERLRRRRISLRSAKPLERLENGLAVARGRTKAIVKPPLAFTERAWVGLVNRSRTVLIVAAIVSVLLLPMALRIGFENNLLNLQAQQLESVQWEHRILKDSSETWFGAVIADSQEEALALIERAEALPTIGAVSSVFDVVEPDTPQRAALRRALAGIDLAEDDAPPAPWDVDELNRALRQLEMIARSAAREAPEESERLGAVASDLRNLAALLASDDPDLATAAHAAVRWTIERIGESVRWMLEGNRDSLRQALPAALRDRFISPRGRYLLMMHPVENVWEYEPLQAFVNDLLTVHPEATGVPLTQLHGLNEMRRAFQIAAILAFAAVFALLWIDLRNLRDALFATAPLLIGMLWLVELMGLTGIQFNLANFFAVPILIGIGVDSGIHIMRRYREDAGDDDEPLHLGSTRRAVFTTSMTSIIGFGCLATASHQGLQSLGLVMAMGAGSLLIASLIVLPALMGWWEGRKPARAVIKA